MSNKRKPKKKNNYFTKVHELVDKIVYTYKFNTLPNIDYLKDDCKLWLITILDKYDPERKSKAFSYFSVITKNWFIHKVKQNSKRLKRDVQYEDISKDLETEKLIEIFNKKAIYLYMREITGLNTKQIVNNLNKIRKRYRNFRSEWEKGKI